MLDTSTPLAKAQYDACVAFARAYRAQPAPAGRRPRVLLTGFTRFGVHTHNASGRMVNRVVPAATYRERPPRAPEVIDRPEPQTGVGDSTVSLPSGREVAIRAMILPVAWDLSAVLVARELEAFAP